MRKFITIIFLSMMITVSAFGGSVPDNYHEPVVSSSADSWDLGSFSKDVTHDKDVTYAFIHDNPSGGNNACSGYGTKTDECSAVFYVARTINKNGGKFCLTQVQAGNKDNKYYTWIDYYEPSKQHCITLCRDGNCGTNTCTSDSITWVEEKDTDKKEEKTYINNEKGSTPFTTEMQVLKFENELAKQGPESREAHHYLLAIVKTTDHGAKVAPVKVIAKRSQPDGADFAWIKAIQKSDQETLLCEDGYAPNGGDCTKVDSICNENSKRCSGFENDYDKTIHELVQKDGDSCYQYKCKQTGYGLASKSDHSCIQCNKSKKWGANEKTGHVCTECPTGQIFHETNSCQSARSISKQTMFEKWKKTTINEFKCALGIGCQ